MDVLADKEGGMKDKSEQSHDSSAYIDWNTEEIQSPNFMKRNNVVNGEFVTVVTVEPADNDDNNNSIDRVDEKSENTFVTVLSVGHGGVAKENEDDNLPENVLVYRLPGERLGFGLKFEGGLNTDEKVNKLLIQSCAPDSPASRTAVSWGFLAPGDEILEIDSVPVCHMTRVECVRRLKESNVVVKLQVRKGASKNSELNTQSSKHSLDRSWSLPPPVPPRKYPRRISAPRTRPCTVPIVYHSNGFGDNYSLADNIEQCFPKQQYSPKAHKGLHRVTSLDIPDADVYTNVISHESLICNPESESDDTGSSLSTVIDMLSSTSNSSFSDARSVTSLDISTDPSSPALTAKTLDLDKVLEPFLQLEREFSSNPIRDQHIFKELVAATVLQCKPSECYETTNAKEFCLSDNSEFQSKISLARDTKGLITNPKLCANKTDELESDVSIKPQLKNDAAVSKTAVYKFAKKRPPPPPPPYPHYKSERAIPMEPELQTSESNDNQYVDASSKVIDNYSLDGEHLPRLIDFVPKDRTDVIAPNAIHPPPIELLLERQRILEIINNDQNQNVDDCDRYIAGFNNTVDSTSFDKVNPFSTDPIVGQCLALPKDAVCDISNTNYGREEIADGASTPDTYNEDSVDHSLRSEEEFVNATYSECNKDIIENHVITRNALTSANVGGNFENEDTVQLTAQGNASEELQTEHCSPIPTDASVFSDFSLQGKIEKCSSVATSESKSNQNVAEVKLQFHDHIDHIRDEQLPNNNVNVEKNMNSVLAIAENVNLKLSAPPSCSRMPPDGHEFPSNYQEVSQDNEKPSELFNVPVSVPSIPYTDPPICKKKSTSRADVLNEAKILDVSKKYSLHSSCSMDETTLLNKSTYRSQMWRNDEKSERSVKDKIAMFSNAIVNSAPSASSGNVTNSKCKSGRFKSTDDTFVRESMMDDMTPASKVYSKSVLSVNNIGHCSTSVNPILCNGNLSRVDSICTKTVPNGDPYSILERANPENDNLDYTNRTQSSIDLTLSSSSSAYSSCSPESSLSPMSSPSYTIGSSSTLPRKNKIQSSTAEFSDVSKIKKHPTLTRATSFAGSTNLHSRSQSLSDVLHSPIPRHSTNLENGKKDSCLSALIEQRRRTMSKLRGLVIPEKVSENVCTRTIFDLPEIKCKETINNGINTHFLGTNSTACLNGTEKSNKNTNNCKSPINTTDCLWKSPLSSQVVDMPKYSPAFKRKSLTVYGVSSSASSLSSSLSSSREELRSDYASPVIKTVKPSPPSKPPRTSLSNNLPPNINNEISSPYQVSKASDLIDYDSTNNSDKYTTDRVRIVCKEQTPLSYISSNQDTIKYLDKNVSSNYKISDDSDNDSAVSSSRSSLCHDLSPPVSPIPRRRHQLDYINESQLIIQRSNESSSQSSSNRTLRRTLSSDTTASIASSTASTLTSGSQASCSSNGDSAADSKCKRVLKPQSVEAINRKNVLSSARYSSGQDFKAGSPPIQKFIENGRLEELIPKSRHSIDICNEEQHWFEVQHLNELNSSELCRKQESHIEVGYFETQDSDEDLSGRPINQKEICLFAEVNSSSNCESDKDSVSDMLDAKEIDPPMQLWDSIDGRICQKPAEDGDINKYKKAVVEINNDTPILPKVNSSVLNVRRSIFEENTDNKLNKVRTNLYDRRTNLVENSRSVSHRSLFNNKKPLSVNDLRKAFEKPENISCNNLTSVRKGDIQQRSQQFRRDNHARMSSLDSTTSEESFIPRSPSQYGSTSNLLKDQQFGSITSLASSTSLISQQELQQLIEDANHTLEEMTGSGGYDVMVIILHRDTVTSSIGITLAGGADYECKEITVHKVLSGSPADRDGRIQKGDRILSINGRNMKDVTHRDALSILKAPRSEVVLVVSRWKTDGTNCIPVEHSTVSNLKSSVRPSRISENIQDNTVTDTSGNKVVAGKGPVISVTVVKDGGGLGFSLEGGKDSPLGDLPLTIKKIFTGGCAEKSGLLSAGDELVSLNGTNVTTMSRTEAWNLMKRLSDGQIVLNVCRQIKAG